MKKKPLRQKKKPRDLSKEPDTGAQRLEKAASRRYRSDIDGPLRSDAIFPGELVSRFYFVIIDQKTGAIVETCKMMTKSEVDARVKQLNSNTPLTVGDKRSLGILRKPERVSAESIPSIGLPSPTECVERLISLPPIRAELHEYQSTKAFLTQSALVRLVEHVLGPDVWASFCALSPGKTERYIGAVSGQLRDKFGIRRPNNFEST